MKLNKKEVAQNLRLFGYKRYGTMKKFAEALDMNPSTLYSGYLNGRSLPGPVLLVKLIDLGCNINWLLTSRETPFAANQTTIVNATDDESIRQRVPLPRTVLNTSQFVDTKKSNGVFADSRR
ncbi:MAG: helix-turn-helix transcriptional regulator [Bacteriovoracaceae bacterium]|nr:helix-turn-helix domain-containing protein [Bacteroidota bacterium]